MVTQLAFDFDDDAFDAEVLAMRLPASTFTTDEMCQRFHVRRDTLMKAVREGRVPPPAIQPRDEREPVRWTALQVVLIDSSGWPTFQRTPNGERPPCGTYKAFRRHVRYGEPVDELCQEARRRYGREQKKAERQRKELVNA